MPLYVTAEEAAQYAGIGRNAMYEFLNSSDPPPFLRVGKKRLIQTAALEAYLERKQEVRNGS